MSSKPYSESFCIQHMLFLSIILLILIISSLLILIYMDNLEYDKIQIVERTIDSLVLVDGYTECVFIVDGKKYNSNEYPCNNKIGETVKTKLWRNEIVIIEENKK